MTDIATYNFAYLDEQTKRMIRRAILKGIAIPEAYERLLLDALNGDASLFARSDGIELSWKIIDPILQGFRGNEAPPLEIYERGSFGPAGADELLGRDRRSWQSGCGQH